MPWYNQKWMDSVKFQALERLDLVDTRAVSDLVYNYVMEALGGIIGSGSGCVSAPVSVYSNNGVTWTLALGAFQFYYSFPARSGDGTLIKDAGTVDDVGGTAYGDGKQKAYRGALFTHDPIGDSGQASLSALDITALVAHAHSEWDFTAGSFTAAFTSSLYPWLWARPVLMVDDQDARREWDVGTNAEQAINPYTRERTRVEFRLALLDPSLGIQADIAGIPTEHPWVRIGRVTGYDLATDYDAVSRSGPDIPRIQALSMWDNLELASFTQEPGSSTYAGKAVNAGGEEFAAGRTGVEEQYGLPPFTFIIDPVNGLPTLSTRANTSSASPFLNTVQSWTNSLGLQGFEDRSNIKIGGLDNPDNFGLIPHLHVVRNRIKEHLLGDHDYRDSAAWFEQPTRGLEEISNDLVQVDVDLAANAAAIAANTAYIQATVALFVIPLGWGWFDYDPTINAPQGDYTLKQSGSSGAWDLFGGIGAGLPFLPGGANEWTSYLNTADIAGYGLTLHHATFQPCRNVQDGLLGSVDNGYDPLITGPHTWRVISREGPLGGAGWGYNGLHFILTFSQEGGAISDVRGSFLATIYGKTA